MTLRETVLAHRHRVSPWWVAVAVIALGAFEGLAEPAYWLKTLTKITLFTIVPLLLLGRAQARQLLRRPQLNLPRLAYAGLGVLAVVFVVVIVVAAKTFDLSGMVTDITKSIGSSPISYIVVALYIVVGNSFIEEFFFRGFALSSLRGIHGRMAVAWSSTLFAAYHIAIIATWSSPAVVVGTIVALFAVGVLMCWIRLRSGSVLGSWAVHACANAVINTAGFVILHG